MIDRKEGLRVLCDEFGFAEERSPRLAIANVACQLNP